MLKKIFYSIHKILGTILCILFLVWFLSGFVMIYHTFPKVSNMDKYKYMDIVGDKESLQSVDSIYSRLSAKGMIMRFSLKSIAGKPYFESLTMDGITRLSADTALINEEISSPSFPEIKEYAQRWNEAQIIRTDTLRELEQWIPFGYLKKDFPIYKFYFGDTDKHQLYVSSVTGDALQFTNKDQRFWSWLGPIPHWVYFTSLRQNSELWSNILIILSGMGCIMCITGIILGIRSYVKQYRRKKKWATPYRKFSYKWHHILGFVFGVFVFTFVFSGMMSLADLPQWMIKVHNPAIQQSMYLPQPINITNYKLNYTKLLEAYPNQVKSIEWSNFGQLPLYKVVVKDRLLTIDASSDTVKTLSLNEQSIRNRLSLTHTEPIEISVINEYDNYYVGLTDHLPLPVYKAEVADADNSTYYINPKNGNTRYFNNNLKAHRWTYQALHSYKIGFLAKHPVLWNIVMWTTMIGGTLVSITGVWLGFKYLKRRIRKVKKTCSSK